MARSVDDVNSRYVQGGTTSVSGRKLGWWDKRSFESDQSDIEITIDNEFHKRPDKLAFRAYGKQSYMWFILQYNNILEPNEEFIEGAKIRLPLPNRVFLDIMTEQPGGQESNV